MGKLEPEEVARRNEQAGCCLALVLAGLLEMWYVGQFFTSAGGTATREQKEQIAANAAWYLPLHGLMLALWLAWLWRRARSRRGGR